MSCSPSLGEWDERGGPHHDDRADLPCYPPPTARPHRRVRFGMLHDETACIGCTRLHGCLPGGRNQVPRGPCASRSSAGPHRHLPRCRVPLCSPASTATTPPCVVCPTGASHIRKEDGIVDVNPISVLPLHVLSGRSAPIRCALSTPDQGNRQRDFAATNQPGGGNMRRGILPPPRRWVRQSEDLTAPSPNGW